MRIRSFAATLIALAGLAPAQSPSAFLRVDAFGYEPFEEKVAILRSPITGFDAGSTYTPPAAMRVERVSDGAAAFTGPVTAWQNGSTDSVSGDRAWALDFSALSTPGTYRIVDPASGEESEAFEIAADPASAARRHAFRTFYYQRCAFAKVAPFADPRWTDGASHVGPEQDLDCRSVLQPTGPGRDLSGGWYDAGDYNKYVNFTDDVLQQMLAAYTANPGAWGDDQGLPESGNGVSDLLDEIRFGLDWMLRMQTQSGGLLHKVSVTDFSAASPPSQDTAPRRYAEVTASATASGAATFARAAHVFRGQPGAGEQAFADQLEAAALAAWAWLGQNPAFSSYDNAGFQNVAAEDSAWHQGMVRVNAAVWLAHLTGDAAYHGYVASNYDAYPQFELMNSGWSSPYQFVFTEALLRYAELPGANATVRTQVRSRFLASMQSFWLAAARNEASPYRAWMSSGDHVWGSNSTRARIGAMHGEAMRLSACDAAGHARAARDYAHWFHGVNALGITHLSNMGDFGAETSVQEIYHAWFADGTVWDRAQGNDPGPAPGFVPGGPNAFYAPDPAYSGPPLEPPMGQPAAKSYLDWNAGWPIASWSVTEPSTGYQSSYLLLLAHTAPSTAGRTTFCEAEPNSTGLRAHASASGPASITANALTLHLACAPTHTFGLFFYGPASQRVPAGNGVVCVASPRRIAPTVAIGGAGAASLDLNLSAAPFASGPSAVAAGETWIFQAWHRDGIGAGFSTSDALALTFAP